ncbi:hypothetical protein [Gephyromycinifex aptenodytis]|uniref:hypothetical protein n=1 Tax=Gephyromycinifex aptenodytis TaxID=2716227 RepID=UPI001444F361|nr:hypothetical protein [Gephyromycinifex aptenodytis]
MFDRKKKKVVVPTVETKTISVPTAAGLKDKIVPAVTGAAAIAKDRSSDYVHTAGEWAKPHLEQSRELAESRVGEAKSLLDGSLPKLTAALTSASAGTEEARQRAADAALVLKGDAVIKQKKKGGFIGKVFSTLGLLALAGAAAALVAKKASEPKDDPWARPLTDPYVAPATGRESSVVAGPGAEPVDSSFSKAAAENGEASSSDSLIGDVPADTPTTPPSDSTTQRIDLTGDGERRD